jgi:hypothetical protein
MITKFAKAEILDVRSSKKKQKHASLDKFASIGDKTDYRVEDGYIYTKVRAISSRVNKNNDGWPSEELAKAYSTFIGKPIFVDHNNSDPTRARGVVVDARLHVEEDLQRASAFDPYYATAPNNHKPPTWIELLLETDARQFPKLAQAIISGDIDSVSMGANVERTQCNICDNWATSAHEYCDHIKSKGASFDFFEASSGSKTSRKSYEDCYDIHFFEISYVFDPADSTALVLDKIASVKTALQNEENIPQSDLTKVPDRVNTMRQEEPCPDCGNEMEDGKCEVCGYEAPADGGPEVRENQPPESLANPDIDAARDNLSELGPNPDEIAGPNYGEMSPNVPPGSGLPTPVTRGPASGSPLSQPGGGFAGGGSGLGTFSTVKGSDTKVVNSEWEIVKDAGLLTRVEKPILPPNRITNDKVVNPKTLENPQKPVESNTKENQNMSKEDKLNEALGNLQEYLSSKTAAEPTWSDGHTQHQDPNMAVDAGPAPDTMTFSDEGQEDPVTSEVGSAGQGPIGVAASTHEAGEMPDFIKEKMKEKEEKNEDKDEDEEKDEKEEKKEEKKEAASKDEDDDTCKKCGKSPCKCDDDEEKEEKTSASKSDDEEEEEEEKDEDDKKEEKKASKKMAKALGIERHEVLAMLATAGADLVLDVVEEMILDKKSVKKAVKQARKEAAQQGITAPGAEAQDRVAVDGDLLEEVGEGTKTFGSDDFHITDPVGGDNANTLGGPIGTAFASEDDVRSHIFRSLKIAETEIELGLIEEGDKFERASSLEKESSQELDAREETLVRVKKNSSRTASKKVAGRVPSLKTASFQTQSSTVVSSEEADDASLFM